VVHRLAYFPRLHTAAWALLLWQHSCRWLRDGVMQPGPTAGWQLARNTPDHTTHPGLQGPPRRLTQLVGSGQWRGGAAQWAPAHG
jgi:hypothetical protein